MIADLRIAARGLRRSPAFTLAAIFTLALGIGANTTMFSIVNAVLLRPLPGYQTGRLVRILENGRQGRAWVDPERYLRLREMLHSFAPLAANQYCRLNLTGQGEAEQVNGPCATADWFELQRASAMLGRTFLPDEDRHGRNHVVVLDHAFWQRRFGADPKIAGKTVSLDGAPWIVIGVMPPGYRDPDGDRAQIYTPYVVEDNPHGLHVTGRLRPGASLQSAQAELDVTAAQLGRERAEWKGVGFSAVPLLEEMTGPQRPLLALLFGAVSFVLLIACANAANLLLARSAARRDEMAIRLALGATRARIVRFVLAEAVLVSCAAAALALAIAAGSLRLLEPLTSGLPRSDELSIDWRVLLWSLTAGVGTALLFGLLPALRSAQPVSSRGRRITIRPQSALVSVEIALAFVLLSGAVLVIQSFVAIRGANLGYDPRNVLTSFLALPAAPDGGRTAGALLYARIRERIAMLPGVRAVATASAIPMFGVQISMDVHPEGEPERHREHVASMAAISDDYLRVMRIPLRAGRGFTPADRDGSAPVVMVSESIARRYFQGGAIGRRLVLPEFQFNIDGGADRAAEIVGVTGDVCRNSVRDCDAEHIYLPESQNALRMENLVIRTEGDPRAMIAAVRRAMAEVAPEIPLDEPQTLEERTGYLSSSQRQAMWLLGVFAGLAALLAAAGVYGVTACLAAQRRPELAIRMALGATARDVVRLLYRSTLLPAVVGLAIGVAAAIGLTRLLASLLFGVTPTDPGSLAGAAVALLAVSLAAATGPAVRAAVADPGQLLRRD